TPPARIKPLVASAVQRNVCTRPGLSQSFQRLLRLIEPECHAHVTVHRGRGGEMLLCQRALARAPVELAEAEVAVGGERAHAAWLGEGERFVVVAVRPYRGRFVRRARRSADFCLERRGLMYRCRIPGPERQPRRRTKTPARCRTAASGSRRK